MIHFTNQQAQIVSIKRKGNENHSRQAVNKAIKQETNYQEKDRT